MRDVAEASEPGHGAIPICDIGPGGEPVRLLSDSSRGATLVWFVPSMGPGVKAVNVVEGGPPSAQRAALKGHPNRPASVRTRTEAGDMKALSVEDDTILSHLSSLWQQARQTKSTPDLEAAADFAIGHVGRPWPSDQWVEMCLMIGGNATVALWGRQRDAEAALRRLRPLAATILERRWLQGGPHGHFGAAEAQRIMSTIGAAEHALTPAPPPVTPTAPRPAIPTSSPVASPPVKADRQQNASNIRLLVILVAGAAVLYLFSQLQPVHGTVGSLIILAVIGGGILYIRQLLTKAGRSTSALKHHSVFVGDRTPEAFIQRAAAAAAGLPKHTLNSVGGSTLVVTRSYLAAWRIVVAVLLFPIGLIALIGRNQETATITALTDGGRTRVTLDGAFTSQLIDRINAILN